MLCRFLQKHSSTFFSSEQYVKATAEYCASQEAAAASASHKSKLTSAQILDEPVGRA